MQPLKCLRQQLKLLINSLKKFSNILNLNTTDNLQFKVYKLL